MNTHDDFAERNRRMIAEMARDEALRALSAQWYAHSSAREYSYHFEWLGRPIIQFPQDIVAMQEVVWRVRPRLIVETGVARGGSLVFYASLLEMLGGDGVVLGIDVDIREHNRREIESHPMFKRIRLVQGSSVDEAVVRQARSLAADYGPALVVLDSCHTHAHVLGELEAYSPLVARGGYLVVFDTVIEFMPPEFSADRPWGPGNSPMSAVREFLAKTDRFEIDQEMTAKLQISAAPDGYLRCVKD